MTTTTQDIDQLLDRWVQAELAADVDALDTMAVEDYRLVGPAGFVLERAQWLERYRGGRLHTATLSLDERDVRVRDGLAITISVQTQTASYDEHRADGRFRTTHIAVRSDGGWLLAGQHLSGMITPPSAS